MPKINKKDLLNIIDSQINYLLKEKEILGWTNKALQIAFITLTWLLLNEARFFYFPNNSLPIIILFVFAVLEFIVVFNNLATTNFSYIKFETRYSHIMPDTRSEFVLKLIKTVALIATTHYCSIGPIGKIASYVYLFLDFFGYSVILIMSIFKIPIGISTQIFNSIPIGHFLGFLLNAIVVISTGQYLYINFPQIFVSHFKIGGLIAILYYVLIYLARNQESMFLTSLKQLRVNISFNKIKISEANNKAEMLIMGMKFSHVFQNLYQELAAYHDSFMKHIKSSYLKMKEIKKNFDTLKKERSRTTSPEKLLQIKKKYDEMEKNLISIKKDSDSWSKKGENFWSSHDRKRNLLVFFLNNEEQDEATKTLKISESIHKKISLETKKWKIKYKKLSPNRIE